METVLTYLMSSIFAHRIFMRHKTGTQLTSIYMFVQVTFIVNGYISHLSDVDATLIGMANSECSIHSYLKKTMFFLIE